MANSLHDTKNIAVLIVTPGILTGIIYILRQLFDYVIRKKEAKIEDLKGRHAEKLEVLKEKTNFDRTKELLVRYSNGEDIKELENEVRQSELRKQEMLRKLAEDQEVKPRNRGAHDRDVYGGIMNLVLGEDEMGPDRRYALICGRCLQHNGLAPPGERPENVKYICPRCGFVNGLTEPTGQSVLTERSEGSEVQDSRGAILVGSQNDAPVESSAETVEKPKGNSLDDSLDKSVASTEHSSADKQNEIATAVEEKADSETRSQK
ncbi:DEKNAAC103348 [Brettanomyces naardenensis]|uniref:Endoplasmic reticulum junction formation protein lunapark n=1 Tax=Brettanomyces naardenensis TaxID=13370 RepID=A0A448YP01_BRENA|nr:DEKNAAC103348 [Brettanomyces naardenensis]